MAAICGGVDVCESTGGVAEAGGASLGGRDYSVAAGVFAEAAKDGRVQSGAGVSGMERCATARCIERDGTEFGMDGGGVCAAAEIYERKYRKRGGFGWSRELSGGEEPRERRDLSDRSHWRVGTLFLCARAVWFPAALHGAAAR